jgi:dipeptidyl aminopeptidase/acylaminoacyl peptidase
VSRSGGTPLRRELLAFEKNTSARLSPDGRSVAFVRNADDGQQLWVRTAAGAERPLGAHPGEMLSDLRWTADGSVLLYRYAQRGREAWRLAGVRPATAERTSLRPAGPVGEYWTGRSDPAAVVYSSRTPRSAYPELFRADLGAPEASPAQLKPNPGFHRWLVDGQLRQRGGIRLRSDGAAEVVLGESLDTAREVLRIGIDAVADLFVQGFSADGRRLYLLTSQQSATRRLIAIDARTGGTETIFAHPSLDLASYPIAGQGVWCDPGSGMPDVCSVMGRRLDYFPLTERLESVISRLQATDEHMPVIIDRSADDQTWLVVHVRDNGPIDYRLFDTRTGRSATQFVNRPALVGYRLPRLEDFSFTASDGRALTGFAMRPLEHTLPLPTVVLVHGGPAGRDIWRFHADAQYLASLGYLSLHINFRGSTGYGTGFRLAGNGEWGGLMQQDLYDAVAHAVSTGLADPGRVAMYGASYGGYAALLGACTRPDVVRCAVAISPPCDLVSLAGAPGPYWQSLATQLRRQVLCPETGPPLDTAELRRRSPLNMVRGAQVPVLLVHGVRDPRVATSEVDTFAAQAREAGMPIRYLRFADEGHNVKANANRAVMFQAVEEFLEAHLAVG